MRLIDADAIAEKLGIGKECNKCQYSSDPYCKWKPNVVDVCEAIWTAPTDTDTISRQAVIKLLQSRYRLYSWDDGAEQKAEVGAVIREINELPPSPSRPQWIPCSERMPEVTVLCCDTRGEMIIGYPYQDEESSTGYGAVLDDIVMIDCIAWMPLPEPYLKGDTI